jgi:hypothetical protein
MNEAMSVFVNNAIKAPSTGNSHESQEGHIVFKEYFRRKELRRALTQSSSSLRLEEDEMEKMCWQTFMTVPPTSSAWNMSTDKHILILMIMEGLFSDISHRQSLTYLSKIACDVSFKDTVNRHSRK